MRTATKTCFVLGLTLCCLAEHTLADDAMPKQIQGLKLIDGYTHEPLQGIDSIVGKIVGKQGVTIMYEIGAIPQPGGLRVGGMFSDRAAKLSPAQRKWYKEQTVAGEPVHVAYTTGNRLLVSFPKRGANFSAEVTDPGQMADVLLMLMSIPAGQ